MQSYLYTHLKCGYTNKVIDIIPMYVMMYTSSYEVIWLTGRDSKIVHYQRGNENEED